MSEVGIPDVLSVLQERAESILRSTPDLQKVHALFLDRIKAGGLSTISVREAFQFYRELLEQENNALDLVRKIFLQFPAMSGRERVMLEHYRKLSEVEKNQLDKELEERCLKKSPPQQ